jgi:hypothetical protein
MVSRLVTTFKVSVALKPRVELPFQVVKVQGLLEDPSREGRQVAKAVVEVEATMVVEEVHLHPIITAAVVVVLLIRLF